MSVTFGTLLFSILSLVLIFALLFNYLIRLYNITCEAEADVNVQLKRRHDLIPKLVDAVSAYSAHEKRVLEDIAKTRSECLDTGALPERSASESRLAGSIRSILALAESYPDLKADQNFLSLQKEISAVEDAIQNSRRLYNGAVRNYNVLAQSFPALLIARAANFKSREYFELAAQEDESPPVRF
ncbi:MAG: LemA family protein [Candidatus Wallbacteria bacterium]|nr:LemA family protein [Candidatus Wallbacteria bacterium]